MSDINTPNLDMVIRREASNIEIMEVFQSQIQYLKNQYGIDIKYEIGTAPVDFVLFTADKPIYIERKTISDFAASIKDKRLWEQADAMKKEASRGIFIIEGSMFSIDQFHPDFKNSLIGAQRKLIKDGHQLYLSYDKDWTAIYLRLELEELKGIVHKRRVTLRPAASPNFTLKKQAQYIVEGFPGVGGATSEKIRTNSDSLWQFLQDVNYKTDSIGYIPRKLVDKIKDVCMTSWRK
jgi:ERCC4-type nuclease